MNSMPGGPGEDGNSVNNKTTGSLGSPLLAGGQKEVEDKKAEEIDVMKAPTDLEKILVASNHQDTRNTIKQNYSKQIIQYLEIYFNNKHQFDGGLLNISLTQFPEKALKEIIEICNLIQRLVNIASAYNEEIDDATLYEAISNYAENILSMDTSYLISLKEAIPGITLSHLFSGYEPLSRDIPSMFMNYPIFKLNKGKAVEQCINNIKGLNTLFKTTISAQDLIDNQSLNHCIWNMKTENAKQQILLFLNCEYEKGGITVLNHLGRIEPNIFDTLGNDGITADEISQLMLPGVDNKQITKIVFIKKHEELFKNLLNTGYIEPNDLYDGDWFLNNLQSIVTQMGVDVPGCEINSAEQIKNYCTKHIENYYTSDGSFFSMYRPKLFDQKLLQQHIISLMGKGKRNRVSLDYLPSMLDHLETIGYKLEDLPYAIKQDLLIAGLEYLSIRKIAAIMRVLTQEEKEQYEISMLIAKMADDSNNETVNRFIISYDKAIDLSELYKKLQNKFPSLGNMGKMSVEERMTLIQTTFFQGETRIKDENNYNKMIISRHFGEQYIQDYFAFRVDFLMHNPYVAEILSGDSIKTFNELLQKFDTYDNPSLKQYLTDAQNYFQNDCRKLPYLRSFERFNQLLATYGTYEDVGFKKYVTDAQDYFSKVNDIPQLDKAKKFDELLEKYGSYESKDFQSYLTNVIDYFSKVKKISGLDTLEKFDELTVKYGAYKSPKFQTYLTNVENYFSKVKDIPSLNGIVKFDELVAKYGTYENPEFQKYLANVQDYFLRVKDIASLKSIEKFDELLETFGGYDSGKFKQMMKNITDLPNGFHLTTTGSKDHVVVNEKKLSREEIYCLDEKGCKKKLLQIIIKHEPNFIANNFDAFQTYKGDAFSKSDIFQIFTNSILSGNEISTNALNSGFPIDKQSVLEYMGKNDILLPIPKDRGLIKNPTPRSKQWFLDKPERQKYIDKDYMNTFLKFGTNIALAIIEGASNIDSFSEFYSNQLNTVDINNQRSSVLQMAEVFSLLLSKGNFEIMNAIDPRIHLGDVCKEFIEKYAISDKGKTIVTLLFAKEINTIQQSGLDYSLVFLAERVVRKLDSYNQILSQYDLLDDELKTSIGMEYEVTKSIAEEYTKRTHSDYKADIEILSAYSGIAKGNDAIHEIATRPTDNPYLLLLELKLLDGLDFINLNFDMEGYDRGSRSYHVTVGGTYGIQYDQLTHFMQNVLIASNLGGINAGNYIHKVNNYSNSRDKGGDCEKVFGNSKTPVTEFRSLSIDTAESFERSTLSLFHMGVAKQAVDKYVDTKDKDISKLMHNIDKGFDGRISSLKNNHLLKENNEMPNPNNLQFAYEFFVLINKTQLIIDNHNNSFYNQETKGYLDEKKGEYVDEFLEHRNNTERFNEIIRGEKGDLSANEYITLKSKIKKETFFEDVTPNLVNTFTFINNLYLKPPTNKHNNSSVNAKAVFDCTQLKDTQGNIYFESDPKAGRMTIFDHIDVGTPVRTGRYQIQGSSDKMIVNALQQAVLDFNDAITKIIHTNQQSQHSQTTL